MDKKPNTIESLLTSGQETNLTASERALMLSELQSYAVFHNPAEVVVLPVTVRQRVSLFLKWSMAVSAVFLLAIGTGVASTASLPGESLYALKVSVVEPVIGLSYMGEAQQLHYQVVLVEKRVSEIQVLTVEQKLNEVEILAVEDQMVKHSRDISDILSNKTANNISAEVSLAVSSEVVSALRTQEVITDRRLGKSRKSKVDEVSENMTALYLTQLDEFMAESPEQVTTYIQTTLSEITADIESNAAVESSSVNEVGDYLQDVSEALEQGDLRRALLYTGEAQQSVETNKSLEVVEEGRAREDRVEREEREGREIEGIVSPESGE